LSDSEIRKDLTKYRKKKDELYELEQQLCEKYEINNQSQIEAGLEELLVE